MIYNRNPAVEAAYRTLLGLPKWGALRTCETCGRQVSYGEFTRRFDECVWCELERGLRLDRWQRDIAGELLRTSSSDANLHSANLHSADLRGATLRDADLRCTNLCSTDLCYADVTGCLWPAPPMVLLAWWGELGDQLTVELMRYDAANHPDPTTFDRWRETSVCPYDNVHVQRSAHFHEREDLWSPGPAKSAYELMQMVLREKCREVEE